MLTLIAGSRTYYDSEQFEKVLAHLNLTISAVIEGEAKGADTLARNWGEERSIPVIKKPANWVKHGRALAGRIRNQEMVDLAEQAIYFWDGHSTGTLDCMKRARRKGIPVYVYFYHRAEMAHYYPLGLK